MVLVLSDIRRCVNTFRTHFRGEIGRILEGVLILNGVSIEWY